MDRPADLAHATPTPAAGPLAAEPAASPAVGPMNNVEGMSVGAGYQLIKLIGSGGFGEVWMAAASLESDSRRARELL
jgi:hypothetical protein